MKDRIAGIAFYEKTTVGKAVSLLASDPHHIDSSSLKDSVRDALLVSFFITDDSWLQRHLCIRTSGSALRQSTRVDHHNTFDDLEQLA